MSSCLLLTDIVAFLGGRDVPICFSPSSTFLEGSLQHPSSIGNETSQVDFFPSSNWWNSEKTWHMMKNWVISYDYHFETHGILLQTINYTNKGISSYSLSLMQDIFFRALIMPMSTLTCIANLRINNLLQFQALHPGDLFFKSTSWDALWEVRKAAFWALDQWLVRLWRASYLQQLSGLLLWLHFKARQWMAFHWYPTTHIPLS